MADYGVGFLTGHHSMVVAKWVSHGSHFSRGAHSRSSNHDGNGAIKEDN